MTAYHRSRIGPKARRRRWPKRKRVRRTRWIRVVNNVIEKIKGASLHRSWKRADVARRWNESEGGTP